MHWHPVSQTTALCSSSHFIINVTHSSSLIGRSFHRHEIAFVFGQLLSPHSVPALVEVLRDTQESDMVRHEAAEALGGIGTPEVLPHLKEWMVRGDSPRVVRESCQVAIDMWEVCDPLPKPPGIRYLINLMADLVLSPVSHRDVTSTRIRINSSTLMDSKRCRLSRSERESIPGPKKHQISVGLVMLYTAVCFGAEIGGHPTGPPVGGEFKGERGRPIASCQDVRHLVGYLVQNPHNLF